MSIDLSQFIGTFLEESYEGLDIMESGLLNFDACDEETINTIFRAAHSIKGGAGTFGFTAVADFTHVVETLLDEVRGKKQVASPPLVNLLLESVDCIKALLEATQDGPEADPQLISQVQGRLEQALGNQAASSSSSPTAIEVSSILQQKSAPQLIGWDIHFSPNVDVLQSGHEPAFMLEALAESGALHVEALTDMLPTLYELEPEHLYLSWKLVLHSDCTEAYIREIFEWIEDQCELSITPAITRTINGWQIRFVPQVEILQTGNEPSLMFEALSEFGRLTICAETEKLPPLSDLCTDELYLSWNMTLESDCSREQVVDIFEWVADACELEVVALSPAAEHIVTSDSVASADNRIVTKEKIEEIDASETTSITPTKAKSSIEASSIRVDTDKIDALINRVGELVITQAMLGQLGDDLLDVVGVDNERLQKGLEQLERNTRDLQEDVMRVRMLPVSFVFNRFPRLVHDVSGSLSKKVELIISGEQTEIDKTVMEKIGDPMVHLVRNSLDHGLEEPAERIAAGKSEVGTVKLNAYHQGGFVVIDIVDDGRGLNTEKIRAKALEKSLITADQQLSEEEINALIFKAGFSTADVVSDLSGRGVGLDVVMSNIESLGGQVSVKSEQGKGSAFSIKLPLTLAILEGQLVRVHEDTYVIPLVSIVETIVVKKEAKNPIAGEHKLLHFRDEYISHLDLKKLFHLPGADSVASTDTTLVAIVENAGKKVGLVVDELYGQQQVVVKSLEVNFKRIEGLSGATILGDGSVALILDVAGLIQRGLNF